MYKAQQLPDGLIAFGPQANCTLDVCELDWSLLRYQPNTAANSIFIAVFGTCLLVHIVQGWHFKTWGYAACVLSGCILEIIGYVGRLIIHGNPFDFNGFLMQIICITVAPVFYCSAIYVLLSQVINFVDPSISRIKPKIFYYFFIPCDVISLVLQAVGGALSCTGSDRAAIKVGEHISLAGLIFQVITLGLFTVLFIDYIHRAGLWKTQQIFTKRMPRFLLLLFLSTALIFVRCCYRIAELGQGYFSKIFRDEGLFIGLESCIMCVAVILLNIGHPGIAFADETGKSPKQADSERPGESIELSRNDEIRRSSLEDDTTLQTYPDSA